MCMEHSDAILSISFEEAFLLFLGVYITAAAIGGLLVPARWSHIIKELDASPTLTFYGGILALLIGLALVLFGTGSWLLWLGAASVLKGTLLLVNPPGLFTLYNRIITPTNGRLISLVLLLFGLALVASALFF